VLRSRENSEKITAIASMNFLMLGKLLSMSVFSGAMCSSSAWNVVKFATLCSVFAISINVLVACGGGCSAIHYISIFTSTHLDNTLHQYNYISTFSSTHLDNALTSTHLHQYIASTHFINTLHQLSLIRQI
jgi:hypothetical protein